MVEFPEKNKIFVSSAWQGSTQQGFIKHRLFFQTVGSPAYVDYWVIWGGAEFWFSKLISGGLGLEWLEVALQLQAGCWRQVELMEAPNPNY